jgi:cation diffusion facilitator family transporter
MTMEELYRLSRRAAALGLFVSLLLAIAKVLGGLYGHSIALLSDSVHSLGDAVVSLVVLIALRWSQVPADREHPYGHTRGEAVIGSNIAMLLVASAIAVIWQAVATLTTASPQPEMYTLVIAIVSIVLKEGLFRYNVAVAERTGSLSVKASAWDHRTDVFSSLAVLTGLLLVTVGGPSWHAADHWAAVFVGLCIGWTGARLFWSSLQELLDRQAEPEVLETVRNEAMAVSGVQQIEKLFARKSGMEYLVDIHVEVNPVLSVREGHTIAHAVKDRVINRMPTVKDVLVHIEPGKAPAEP